VKTTDERGVRVQRTLLRASRALLVLAAVVVGAVLFFARAVFIPVGLALLFALVLSGAVEAAHRRGVPRPLGALLLLLVLLGAIGMVADKLIDPAQQWLSNAPRVLHTIERKARPAEAFIHRIEALTSRAGQIGNPVTQAPRGENDATPAGSAQPVAAKAASSVSESDVLTATGATVASFVTCIILMLFLLSGGPPMLARMAAALAADLHASHALRVIEAMRVELGRYYGTIAAINLGLGVATGFVMLWLGVPNPFLWGVVAGLLNFIPYVGSAATLLVLSTVAFVSFDQTSRILGVIGSYLALATIEGQIVQPFLVGRRLELNPILVFLAVWFGGWFWGIGGIVIAVPALVALKVAASHSENAAPVVEFLSPSGIKALRSIHGRVTKARTRT
jgi:predicted PurR-regulated permease PerM